MLIWSAFRRKETGVGRFRLGVAGVEEPTERMEANAAMIKIEERRKKERHWCVVIGGVQERH